MAYQNINQYNFLKLYLKPLREISDISLTSDEKDYDEEVIFSPYLIAEFDGNRMPLKFDFNSSDTTICVNCGNFSADTIVSENYWNPKSLDFINCTGLTELCDVGLTGIDNGLVTGFTGQTIEINTGLYSLDEDKFNRYKYDRRFKMHPITGFTTQINRIYNDDSYTYDLSYENEGGYVGSYVRLNGGFYQGFYKLQGYDYQVLPERYNWGWSTEFLLRQRRFADFEVGLNKRYPENIGTFFFMGARAENKFYHFANGSPVTDSGYTRVTQGLDVLKTCECYLSATSASTSCTTVYPQSGLTDYHCTCNCGCSCPTDVVVGDKDPLYDGVSNALSFRLSGESNPRLCVKTYRITGGCETTGSCSTTGITYTTGTSVTEWCSTRGIFDDCKDTSYVDGENWVQIDSVFIRDTYLDECDLEYKGGLKEIVKTEYIDSLNNNSVALVTPPITHEEVYAPPTIDVVKITEHWINENEYRKGKLKFYVNGKLFFVVNDFEEIIPRPLNVEKEKQIGVSYNISLGGGTQGLHDNLTAFPIPVCDFVCDVSIDLSLRADINPGSIDVLYTLTSSAPISKNIDLSFSHILNKFDGSSFEINSSVTIVSGTTTGQTNVVLNEDFATLNGGSTFENISITGASLNNFIIEEDVIFPTPTPTQTPTNTITPTQTQTSQVTPTQTPTNTFTPTTTTTSTNTPTQTLTNTITTTITPSQTSTNTQTVTQTPTNTQTPTVTQTPTNTETISISSTPTNTQTPSFTPTNTTTQTQTPTVTQTNTQTPSFTPTNTTTPTLTPSQTSSPPPPPPPTFSMTFQSPNANPTVAVLPLLSTGVYNFTVNWGDGNSDVITTWDDPNTTHTYIDNSSYTITIVSGTIGGFSYENASVSLADRANLRSVDSWGNLSITGSTSVLKDCVNLSSFAVGGPYLFDSNSLSGFFMGCTSLTDASLISTWNLKFTDTLQDLFNGCTSLTVAPSSLDTTTILDMSSTFESCTAFNGDVTSWITSGVTSMNSTFKNCNQFNQDISSWDVSSVNNMNEMFNGALKFTQPIGSWNVSSVTTMDYMFNQANDFNEDISAWDVSNVSSLVGFMDNISYSSTNYDLLLNGWSSLPSLQTALTADFGNINYTSAGESGRGVLVNTYGWTVNDGGKI